VKELGSLWGSVAGGTPDCLGSRSPVDALSLEEEERLRRELQQAFGVTPQDVAQHRGRTSPEHRGSVLPKITGRLTHRQRPAEGGPAFMGSAA